MLNSDFKEFAELLATRGVDYRVVGGYAPGACFARSERVELEGVRSNVIGLEDFRTNPQATGRLEDLADLESLGSTKADPSN